MRKRRVATLALIAGLLGGVVVGVLDDDDQTFGGSEQTTACPSTGIVTAFTARLSVTEVRAQQAEVRASATAELEQAGQAWTPDRLPLCVFANGPATEVQGHPEFGRLGPPQLAVEQYKHEPGTSKVQVRYADTQVGLQPPRTEPDRGSPSRRVPPGLTAYRQGQVLHLAVDLCRSPTGRLVCKANPARDGSVTTTRPKVEPVTVELTIADGIRADNSTVESSPQPTSLQPDAARHQTTYSWRLADPATPVAIKIPLAWPVRWTAQSAPTELSVGGFGARIYWPALWNVLSGLLALALAAGVLARSGKKTTGVGLTVAFVALLAALAIDISTGQNWDLLLGAAAWTTVAVFTANSWRAPLITAAAIGLMATLGGAIGDFRLVLALGLLVTALTGLLALGTRLLVIPRALSNAALAGTSPWFRSRVLPLRGLLVRGALFLLIATAAAAVGDAIGRHGSAEYGLSFLTEVVATTLSNNLGWVVLSNDAVALLILCLCLTQFGSITAQQLLTSSAQTAALTLLIAIVAPPPSLWLASAVLPVWLLTWLTLTLIVRGTPPALIQDKLGPPGRLALAIRSEKSRGEVLALDAQLTAGTTTLTALTAADSTHRKTFPDDLAADLFARGPGTGWSANARTAAWIGTALSLVPIGYYVFGALQTLPRQLPYNGLFYFAVNVFAEFARWMGLAFAFGALYRRLPTRVGAGKGAVLGIAWLVGAGLAELGSRWVEVPASGVWLYVSLQTIVFLIALGAIYDLMTVEKAGGSWRRLTDLYRIQTVRQRLAYLGPLLLALIGLADQIRNGAPGELAEQLLTGVGAAVG